MKAPPRKFQFLFALLVSAACARAVPPLATDDAETTERAQFELFSGFEYLSQDHTVTRTGPAVELDYGVTDKLELAYRSSYVSSQGARGFGDVTLELKYNLLKDQKKLPTVSFTLEWTLPTANFGHGLGEGAPEYFLHVPVEKTWGRFTAMADFGYSVVGEPTVDGMREDRQSAWFIGFAQSYKVTKSFNLLSEIYWATSEEPGKANSLAAGIGFEKEIVKDFTFHAVVERSLRSGALGGPDLRVYAGIHWVFDSPWKSRGAKDDKK
jgi:hypothetical protein